MTGQDKRADLLRQLGEQVEALTSSDEWVRWMETAAKFHNYSFGNQMLIAMQRPDATRVAGYQKGEKGVGILAPMTRKVEDETGDESRILFGFKVVHVFDVAQTDGEDLPDHVWPVLTDGPEGLFNELVLVAQSLGLTVAHTDESPEGARGWYEASQKRITIVHSYPAASQARTMLHELAHSLDPACDSAAHDASRSEKELVAESVAYIVGKRLGLATDECSTFYTASWGGEPKKLEQLAEKVLAIAGQLEGAITGNAQEKVRVAA